jgi:hypothetical protein
VKRSYRRHRALQQAASRAERLAELDALFATIARARGESPGIAETPADVLEAQRQTAEEDSPCGGSVGGQAWRSSR